MKHLGEVSNVTGATASHDYISSLIAPQLKIDGTNSSPWQLETVSWVIQAVMAMKRVKEYHILKLQFSWIPR